MIESRKTSVSAGAGLALLLCCLSGCDETAAPEASVVPPPQTAEPVHLSDGVTRDSPLSVGGGSLTTLGRARDSARNVIDRAEKQSQEIADTDWDE